MATVSRAMTKASTSDPAMVNIQPATASQPKGARLAGSRNTPDPIILPITSAMQAARPSVREEARDDDAASGGARGAGCMALAFSAAA